MPVSERSIKVCVAGMKYSRKLGTINKAIQALEALPLEIFSDNERSYIQAVMRYLNERLTILLEQ